MTSSSPSQAQEGRAGNRRMGPESLISVQGQPRPGSPRLTHSLLPGWGPPALPLTFRALWASQEPLTAPRPRGLPTQGHLILPQQHSHTPGAQGAATREAGIPEAGWEGGARVQCPSQGRAGAPGRPRKEAMGFRLTDHGAATARVPGCYSARRRWHLPATGPPLTMGPHGGVAAGGLLQAQALLAPTLPGTLSAGRARGSATSTCREGSGHHHLSDQLQGEGEAGSAGRAEALGRWPWYGLG